MIRKYFVLLTFVFFSGCTSIQIQTALFTPPEPLLRSPQNPALKLGLLQILAEMDLEHAIEEQRLALALVDITNPYHPQFAGINEEVMMYAASLPKIAILLGLFKRFEDGSRKLSEKTLSRAKDMIRISSNEAATEFFNDVGPEYIRDTLIAYNLYNPKYGGGLWVGKEYGKGEAWKREPILNLAHTATASSVAQLYYLLDRGKLLPPTLGFDMRQVLANPEIDNKFVKGFSECCPWSYLYRKSGSWRTFHSDSAIVQDGRRRYILVALTNDQDGDAILEALPPRIHNLIYSVPYVPLPIVGPLPR